MSAPSRGLKSTTRDPLTPRPRPTRDRDPCDEDVRAHRLETRAATKCTCRPVGMPTDQLSICRPDHHAEWDRNRPDAAGNTDRPPVRKMPRLLNGSWISSCCVIVAPWLSDQTSSEASAIGLPETKTRPSNRQVSPLPSRLRIPSVVPGASYGNGLNRDYRLLSAGRR